MNYFYVLPASMSLLDQRLFQLFTETTDNDNADQGDSAEEAPENVT